MLSTPPAFVLSQDQTLRECFPVIGMNTTRAEQPGGISPAVHSVLAVFFQRNLAPTVMAGDGVSTYLALIFGTLLSSQGTDASFVLTRETLSWLSSGRFPSVLRFRLYQILFRSNFLGAFQVPALAFPFPAVPTLSEPFGPDPQSAGPVFPAVGPFRRFKP